MKTGDAVFDSGLDRGLVWQPELGMGFYPVREADEPYRNGGAQAYWDKYAGYAETELGRALTALRVRWVDRWHGGELVDVGIGCGAFVTARGRDTWGYDISPVAERWLRDRGLWRSPAEPGVVSAVSLWDVLEHLPDPAGLLMHVAAWAFVSVPLFEGPEHALRSRHFRPDEHRWYWTRAGLTGWMWRQGFELVDDSSFETTLGREDIGTFAFRRVA